MDRTKFQLELSLQSISTISFATKLWDVPQVKNKIHRFLSNNRDLYNKVHGRSPWYKVSESVFEYSVTLGLPPRILDILETIIPLIGDKIFDWIDYVTRILKLDLIFTDKIYWTCYGTVDEVKIFNLYWKDIMSARKFQASSKYWSVFSFACMYAQEEFVKEHKNEIVHQLARHYPSITTWELFDVMCLSICLTAGFLFNCTFSCIRTSSAMFDICAQARFSKAARFFWKRLDEIDKKKIPRGLMSDNFKKPNYSGWFLEEKLCEILFSLISQVEEEERNIFFKEKAADVILSSVEIWPYQKLIEYLLEYNWNLSCFNEPRQTESKKLLEMFIITDHEFNNRIDIRLNNQILGKIWMMIPAVTKRSLIQPICSRLLLNFDASTFAVVLNDPDLRIGRDSNPLKDALNDNCIRLMNIGKLDVMIESVEKMLTLRKELRVWLKDVYYRIVLALVEQNNFKKVDVFLDLMSDSKEERAELKNQIDTYKTCEKLISGLCGFRLADSYLKWQLISDEKIKNFKDIHMDKFKDIIPRICKVWNTLSIKVTDGNYNRAADEATAVIKFYYKTDEEVIEFKKTRLNFINTEKPIDFLFANGFESFTLLLPGMLNEFCNFCLIPLDEVEKIRFRYQNEIEKWMDYYMIDEFHLEKTEFLINWSFAGEETEKKHEVLKNYLNSSNRGATLCNNFFIRMTENRLNGPPLPYLGKMFNWLIMIDDMEKLKNELLGLNESSSEWFIELLDVLGNKGVQYAVEEAFNKLLRGQ